MRTAQGAGRRVRVRGRGRTAPRQARVRVFVDKDHHVQQLSHAGVEEHEDPFQKDHVWSPDRLCRGEPTVGLVVVDGDLDCLAGAEPVEAVQEEVPVEGAWAAVAWGAAVCSAEVSPTRPPDGARGHVLGWSKLWSPAKAALLSAGERTR